MSLLHREQLGLNQAQYAALLGVSQPYLSLLESNRRPLTAKLQAILEARFGKDPTQLPLSLSELELTDDTLVHSLGKLGYPGFAPLTQAPKLNPAVLALEVLRKSNAEPRTVEAVVWLLSYFKNLDTTWLVAQAKLRNLQNRLGLLTSLANELTPRPHLQVLLDQLEPARLAALHTLCNDAMPSAFRRHLLKDNRPPLAQHWNLLTNLKSDQLKRSYFTHGTTH